MTKRKASLRLVLSLVGVVLLAAAVLRLFNRWSEGIAIALVILALTVSLAVALIPALIDRLLGK